MILYSKPGCGLCDKAKALLLEARLSYTEVNVLEDEAAMRLYAFEIPVLTDDNGRALLKGNFSEARVAALLLRL
jgi:glutaredoxin